MKSFGYLLSSISVLLLGLVSWDSASNNPTLRLALIAGMSLSIVGMLLRWLQNMRDAKRNRSSQ